MAAKTILTRDRRYVPESERAETPAYFFSKEEKRNPPFEKGGIKGGFLFPMRYALCPMPCTVCPMPSALCPSQGLYPFNRAS
jgi:hypothetical protein